MGHVGMDGKINRAVHEAGAVGRGDVLAGEGEELGGGGGGVEAGGAESIDENLETLDVFYEAGLRSLGPVWSRPTIFGHPLRVHLLVPH